MNLKFIFKLLDGLGLNKATSQLEGVRTQLIGFLPAIIIGLNAVANSDATGTMFWVEFVGAVLGGVANSYFKDKGVEKAKEEEKAEVIAVVDNL